MSLNNDTTNFVLQALKSLMTAQGQCFTAHDVAKSVRSLTEEYVDQNDIKEVVHNLFDQGFLDGFTRINHNIITTDAPGTWVQLFVPPGGDPYTYDLSQVAARASVTTALLDREETKEDSAIPVDKDALHKYFPPQMIGYTGLMATDSAPRPTATTIVPPINLGGQVLLDGGVGGATLSGPTPAPPTPAKPVDLVQQASYLDNWNKPETRTIPAEDGVLVKVKNAIVAKLKELFS